MLECAHLDDTLVVGVPPGVFSKDMLTQLMNELQKKPITSFIGAAIGAVEMSSVYRKEPTSYIAANRIRVAAITDDRLVRGIATASSWVGVNVNAFSWQDLPAAAEYVGFVDRAKAAEAVNLILFLRRALERQLTFGRKAS